MRVLIDTNVFAAGFLGSVRNSSAPPTQILKYWRDDRFEVLTSEHILAELEHVLSDQWFIDKMPFEEGKRILQVLRTDADVVPTAVQVVGITSHWQDDLVLAAAVSGRADYLVTGDIEFRRVDEYQGVRIRTPAEFLQEFRTQKA